MVRLIITFLKANVYPTVLLKTVAFLLIESKAVSYIGIKILLLPN